MNFVLFWTGSGSPGQTTDQEPLDYCLLCAVLLFLADLDDGIPFLLSSLTQAVETFSIRSSRWTGPGFPTENPWSGSSSTPRR